MKNEKGITLIALVVTIIILLILAGVSITTLSGDGLFGRAESSAAKYQAASEAENSTISSILDKYDYYDNLNQNLITIKWDAALSQKGSFINNFTPAEYRTENLLDKQIVAIEPDGTQRLLNPYQATNVKVPQGTKIRFYYYRDTAVEVMYFIGPWGSNRTDSEADGKLVYVEWTPAQDADLEGYFYYEDPYEWNGKMSRDWSVNDNNEPHEDAR